MTSSRLHVVLAVLITFGMACGGGSAPSGGDGALTPAAVTPTFSPAAGTYTAAQSVTLSSATTGATIHYTIDGSTPSVSSTTYSAPVGIALSATIKAIAVASGYTDSAIGSAAYVIDTPLPGVAATPTFSPAAGTFTAAQSVVLASTTSGAVIHYTIDGSTPTAASATYASPVAVGSTMTVKAIAVASGYTDSAVASAAYVIDIPVPGVAVTPAFNPVAGTYSGAQAVTLSTTTPGAAIHYTIDGSTPTVASPTYTAQFTVSASMTVKAIAVATGYVNSDVGSAAYVITAAVALRGIALPSEVSALPTGTSGSPSVRSGALRSARGATLAADLPTDSDYAKAESFKFVSERSLSQFDILNTIFNAMAQTHYEDPAVLNGPAYSAMVAWQEKGDQGQEQKKLVKWIVESTRDSATSPNIVKAWFRMPMKGNMMFTIQAKVVIDVAPTQNTDGSYTDFGVWRMDVKVLEPQNPFHFVASAARDGSGQAVIMMEQSEPGPGGVLQVTKGILHKSALAGSGKVVYPDYESCTIPDCAPPSVSVAYVYDSQNVTLKKGDATPVTKARSSFVDIVNRYGLYDATTGVDIGKTKRFGFPIRATVGGVETFGYYGAWQGRHQIWANGAQLPAGVTVQRADVPSNQAAPQFTTSAPFTGILVKRTYAPAQLSDLTGLVVETFDNTSSQITWDGAHWCTNPEPVMQQFGPQTYTCGATSVIVTDFSAWQLNPTDMRRNVNIGYWDMGRQTQVNFVYEKAGPAGEGFYEAVMSQSSPHPTRIGTTPYVFASGAQLWVNVGGPIYISYSGTGTGWVKKSVTAFDQQTWTPTFDPAGDVPYSLKEGPEYYFNNAGTNYVAKMASGVTSVQLEMQSVANPVNASSFVPTGTTFSQQWCGQGNCSTYAFVTSPGTNYMQLVYATVGATDAGKTAGDPVTTGMWGITATIDGHAVQFNWDYPQQGQMGGGTQQYLMDGAGAYVMLDDPIRLDAVTLANASGARTFTLQFDGNWMQGLPNVYEDLRKAGFEVSAAIKQKAFSVPTGTVIGSYVVKQLQVSEYMETLPSATPLDLAGATAIDLTAIPVFVDHRMGAIPSPAPLKYSEGNPVAL
jgi:hypothetical protein